MRLQVGLAGPQPVPVAAKPVGGRNCAGNLFFRRSRGHLGMRFVATGQHSELVSNAEGAFPPGATQTGWIMSELEQRAVPTIPAGRLGAPEDIADAIVLLASDQSRWITGQLLNVAGGSHPPCELRHRLRPPLEGQCSHSGSQLSAGTPLRVLQPLL